MCINNVSASIWAVLMLCMALHSRIASAAADAPANVSARSYEDCKTSRMVLSNNYEFKGLEVYKFSRGTGSARDCSDQCRRDTSCYAFNYVKLSKWCYLGYTHSRSLRYVANGKMASGYRRCSAHSTNEEWISEIYTVAGAPSTLSATKTDTSASISYSVGAAGNPVETYSVKCVIFGLSCNNAAIGTSLSYPRSTLSIPVSGLSANTKYYCYVVATNSVGAVCSAALEVTTCATGVTC